MERLNWNVIKQIYINVLKHGANIRVGRDQLIISYPENNREWKIYNNLWYIIWK